MNERGLWVSPRYYCFLLQGCINKGDLAVGREIHAHIIRSGLESNTFIGSHLIHMFALCGSLSEANEVFVKLAEQNAFTWSAIISAHSKLGHGEHAINLYHQMRKSKVKPDGYVFVAVLKACTSVGALTEGRVIHAHLLESDTKWDAFIGSTLIDMYAKCGSLKDARDMFDSLQFRDMVTWGSIIAGYIKHGNGEEAIQLFNQMQKEGTKPNQVILLSILKACSVIASLNQGRLIHVYAIESGFERDGPVCNALIDMYAKCGSLESACRLFHGLFKCDVVAWGTLISGCAQYSHGLEALQLFQQMLQEGTMPNEATFIGVVKACSIVASVGQAKVIHIYIFDSGFESNQFVASALVDMYMKCGSVIDAHAVFHRLPERDVLIWSTMIAGCAQHGYCEESLKLYDLMQQESTMPDTLTFVGILKACSGFKYLGRGKVVHGVIVESGYETEVLVGNALINMYARCGSISDARSIFDRMANRTMVTWTAMVEGYTEHGHGQEAFWSFLQMQEEGMELNSIAYISILKACTNITALSKGKMIHARIMLNSVWSDLSVGCTLLDMYAKCGSLEDARKVFHRLPKKDVVLWTSMIVGCVQNGHDQEALRHFQLMQEEGVVPNQVTLVCVLKACSNIAAIEQGKLIHAYIIEHSFDLHDFVLNTAIDMYAKGGSLDDAHSVFERLPNQDVVTWSTLISAYADCGHVHEAVQIFQEMQQAGTEPNQITCLNILRACSKFASLSAGMVVHAHIIGSGFEWDESLCNTLVSMYAKCGGLEDAHWVFDRLPIRDVVAWTAMITGYLQYADHQESFKLLQIMQNDGSRPDQAMFICMLKVCGRIIALDWGNAIHALMIKSGVALDLYVNSALIDMYINCGTLEDACKVFDRTTTLSTVTWNAMVSGCAQHGNYNLALRYFEGMQQEGLKADEATYISLLSACSHVGLVDQGCHHFDSITQGHGPSPTFDHFNLMVDLLGRTGHLNDAEKILQTMPFSPSIVSWVGLLSHSRTHGDAGLAKRCFDQSATLTCRNSASFVLTSSIYADAGMQDDAVDVEEMRKYANAWKEPGKAFIEVGNNMHDFVVGGKSHPLSDAIYAKILRLSVHMKHKGFVPCLGIILHEVKEHCLLGGLEE